MTKGLAIRRLTTLLTAVALFFLLPEAAEAANRYWVGSADPTNRAEVAKIIALALKVMEK